MNLEFPMADKLPFVPLIIIYKDKHNEPPKNLRLVN